MADSKIVSIMDTKDDALLRTVIAIMDERENTLRSDFAVALQAATNAQHAAIRAAIGQLIGRMDEVLRDIEKEGVIPLS